MKKLLCLLFLLVTTLSLYAQKQIFDIATFTAPKAWKKELAEGAVQYSKEDVDKGTYCLITLFKSVPATPVAKENFDLSWSSIVKEMVTVTASPEMQPSAIEDGWEVQSGYAAFEKEDTKGVVVLVTISGFEKMVNIIILTNTDQYEKNITEFISSVDLKKPVLKKISAGSGETNNLKKPVVQTVSNGFAFTTTNFDDGWTSTVQEDWVEVTKGKIKVLIHYPNKMADAYNSVLLDGLKNAWDVLVAPRYSSAENFEFKPMSGWESVEFAEADMVEKSGGKRVHVVLYKKNYSNGNGKYLEFISTDKASFEQEFGAYDNSGSFGTSPYWDKLAGMASYNKFAIGISDLKGKWTNDFSGAIQYVNAYTGFDAGMNTHASAENYYLGPGNSYKWDLAVASGMVGNIKFQSVKSKGTFTMDGNWKIRFSDIEGKPRTYNAYFSCIKGFRILWINDKAFAKID